LPSLLPEKAEVPVPGEVVALPALYWVGELLLVVADDTADTDPLGELKASIVDSLMQA
jgi:hypothetical protein